MFATPVILASVLSTTPPPLARAEFEQGHDSAHVLAFNENNDVAAEIVLWRVDNRHIRIDALFPDGHALTAVLNGEGVVSIDNDDPEAVAERLAAVNDLLAAATEQASWTKCAAYAAISAWELSHASPIGVATAVLAACECLPEIVDEFEGMECF